jgi:hypothetical protein
MAGSASRVVLVALVLLPLSAQQPAWWPEVAARAGENAAELRRALDEAPAEHQAALQFVLREMPDADASSLTAQFLLRDVALACEARAATAWARAVPEDLFLRYVVPYAQANEAREDWRSGFFARFLPLVRDCASAGDTALVLNRTIFDALGVHYSTGRSRADQAPSAAIAEGKASCTGLSILLADACRACGVPARLVSVRWPHKAGNHTWVEVFDGAAWRFVGADEPDPQGFDRAWFTADAARCAAADPEHRAWAVSFARTEASFAAGWARGVRLWGTDESARYAAQEPAGDAALAAQLDRWFALEPAAREQFAFDRNLDEELRTPVGDARLRRLVFAALQRAERQELQADHERSIARADGRESPFTVEQVGERPAGGWPLVIAMHGGGGAPKRVNDSQWRHMQVYYKPHPEVSGYLYCALRAPTDEWNGFYTDYFYPVLERLIRQFVVCADVDPARVIAIGYSHGGYGAFAIGPKLPHRFAHVHASAAAPTDGETSVLGLHSLPFTFMVGGRDTAYGRRTRCEAFARLAAELQATERVADPGRYPVAFTLVEDNGHTGLPDRDLLAEILPAVRRATPPSLAWELTDGVVRDHYWLRVEQAKKGAVLRARIERQDGANRLVATVPEGLAAAAWLDARLVDATRDLTVVVGAAERTVTPSPSLRTLCATMCERGDPELAATFVLGLR